MKFTVGDPLEDLCLYFMRIQWHCISYNSEKNCENPNQSKTIKAKILKNNIREQYFRL